MEKIIIQAQQTREKKKVLHKQNLEKDDDFPLDIDPKAFCKLGHFHLLLEDYIKGQYLWWEGILKTLTFRIILLETQSGHIMAG